MLQTELKNRVKNIVYIGDLIDTFIPEEHDKLMVNLNIQECLEQLIVHGVKSPDTDFLYGMDRLDYSDFYCKIFHNLGYYTEYNYISTSISFPPVNWKED